ncbi:nuclear transport factor 2 family protein [Nocardia sp. NPDC004711]
MNGAPSAAWRDIGELLDRQAIREVITRYCRGIDRLDMDAVRSCYHSDAIDHHTAAFNGTVEEFIAWSEPGLKRFAGTRHIVTNHVCELSGDRAVTETYAITYHWGHSSGDTTKNFVGHGRYVDRFERRGGGQWRIAERWVEIDCTTPFAGTALEAPSSDPGRRNDLFGDLARTMRHS